jgi:hypothetical protein
MEPITFFVLGVGTVVLFRHGRRGMKSLLGWAAYSAGSIAGRAGHVLEEREAAE